LFGLLILLQKRDAIAIRFFGYVQNRLQKYNKISEPANISHIFRKKMQE